MLRLLLIAFLCLWTLPAHAQQLGAQPKEPEITYPTLKDSSAKPLVKIGTGRVTAVIDSLRIIIDGKTTYQLSSLDIPDLNQDDPGEFAFQARNLLEREFKNKDVYIYQTADPNLGRTNRMGHHLAHITRKSDDVWAQGSLLKYGLARVRSTRANRDLVPLMLEMEQKARRAKRGLWASDQYQILTPQTATVAPSAYQIVEGKIRQIATVKNRIYLNFGDRWQTDFTVSLSPETRRLFSKEGHDVMQWSGKTIRVRGWLENYNGPYIELDHPERIEFIEAEQPPQPAQEQPEQQPTLTEETPRNALPDAE